MYRYDFGGWSDALLTDNLYQGYDNFIFVNSSVLGTFLPSYKGKWTDIYIYDVIQNATNNHILYNTHNKVALV